MNPELKELIALLKYRNTIGQPLLSVVVSRDLFLMIMRRVIWTSELWIDGESIEIISQEK